MCVCVCFVVFFVFFSLFFAVLFFSSFIYVSLKAAQFAFCFTCCVLMLTFWSPTTAAHLVSVSLVVIQSGIGTQGEVSRL